MDQGLDQKPLLSPIKVTVASGAKREIRSVRDMLDFLANWPVSRHSDVYRFAISACRLVRDGRLPREAARGAFVEFARISLILRNEVDANITDATRRAAPHRHA